MAKNIVLGVTASIALYKACDLIRRLQDAKYAVNVVMTEEAQKLINPVVFESLSGNKVYCDMFEATSEWEIGHVSLADKADLVLIAPATVNIIAKVAGGICDDLLSCVVSATEAPVLFAPAMNAKMYKNRITQKNIGELKGLGYKFVGPKEGKLACGKTGIGCLADVEEILKAVNKLV